MRADTCSISVNWNVKSVCVGFVGTVCSSCMTVHGVKYVKKMYIREEGMGWAEHAEYLNRLTDFHDTCYVTVP